MGSSYLAWTQVRSQHTYLEDLKMILPLTLVAALLATSGIHAEEWNCSLDEFNEAIKCEMNLPINTWYTCGHLEAAIKCYESINPDCAKWIPAGTDVVDYDYRKGEIRSSDSCYDQKFDQYFNEDGMCSFADFKDLVKCTMEKARECEGCGPSDYECHRFGWAKECVEEMKPNCLGFFKTQSSRFAGWWKKYAGSGGPPAPRTMPECMEVYLQDETEEETETEEPVEFPNFNQ